MMKNFFNRLFSKKPTMADITELKEMLVAIGQNIEDSKKQIGELSITLNTVSKGLSAIMGSQRLIAEYLEKAETNTGTTETGTGTNTEPGTGTQEPNTGSGPIEAPYLSKADQWVEYDYDNAITLSDAFGVNLVANSQQKEEVQKFLKELNPKHVRLYDHVHKHKFDLPMPEGGMFKKGQGYDGYDTHLPILLKEVKDILPEASIMMAIEDLGYGYPQDSNDPFGGTIGSYMGYPNKFPNLEGLATLGFNSWKEFLEALVTRYVPLIKAGHVDYVGFNELRSLTHPGLNAAQFLTAQFGEQLKKQVGKEWKGYFSPCPYVPGATQREADTAKGIMTYEAIAKPAWLDGFSVNTYGTAKQEGFDYKRIIAAPQDGELAARNRLQRVRNLSQGKPVFWTEAGYNSAHTSETDQANAMIHDLMYAASQGIRYYQYGVIDGDQLGKPLFDHNGLLHENGSLKESGHYAIGGVFGNAKPLAHKDNAGNNSRIYTMSDNRDFEVGLPKSMHK